MRARSWMLSALCALAGGHAPADAPQSVRDAREVATGSGTSEAPYLGWQAALAPGVKLVLASRSVFGLATELRLPPGSEIACEDRSAVIVFLAEGVTIANEPNAGGIALRDCTIDANGSRFHQRPRNAIEFTSGTGQDYLFEGLEVRASTKAGIKVLGTPGIPTRIRVAGCTFRETFWHGVDFASGVSESAIVDSEFVRTNRTTEGASIYFSGETCVGNEAADNRIADSGDNGIRVKGSRNVIRANEVDGGRTDGIRDEGMGTLVSHNTIRAPDEVCIKVGRGARDSTVDGNTCVDAGTDNDGNRDENTHGILTYTDLANEKRLDGVVITRNLVEHPGGDCIHLESASPTHATTRALVEENSCFDAGGFGIRATRGSTYRVGKNKIVGSRGQAYSLEGRKLRASQVRRRQM